MIKVAVVISGCGFLDGAEISEAVFTLLELERSKAELKFLLLISNNCKLLII